jgi:hypothetical protein
MGAGPGRDQPGEGSSASASASGDPPRPFLDSDVVLIHQLAPPGDEGPAASSPGLDRLDPGEDPDGVAEGDRLEELPVLDGEERQGVDARVMRGQAAGDRHAE